MSFGDVLNEWESIKRDVRTRKDSIASPAKPEPRGIEDDFRAYLNRHGIVDKDLEIDAEESAADLERAEARRLKNMKPEASIDLHGVTEEEIPSRLGAFLDSARRDGLRKVLVIHGKGNHSEGEPVLLRAVARFLEKYPFSGRTGTSPRANGGAGATWVILKVGRISLPGLKGPE
jgi:DNA-nicking Smr family endonuclease